MPSGHTDKQTLTPYRHSLLSMLPLEAKALRTPARKQLNDCIRFGWAVREGDTYKRTEAGTAAMAAPPATPEG